VTLSEGAVSSCRLSGLEPFCWVLFSPDDRLGAALVLGFELGWSLGLVLVDGVSVGSTDGP
jgi:hypothetical protein